MTTSDYERALSRAHDAGLKVMGKGEWTSGQTFYVVSSASEAGRFHLVTQLANRLQCDCRARALCMHRGLTHEHIEGERRAESAIDKCNRETTAILSRVAASYDNPAPAPRAAFSIWASN